MERWRRGWEQLGGPNALTKWSWILTLPLALVVSGVSTIAPSPIELAVWTSIALLVHVFVGLFMWGAWATLLPHRARRSRPVTALVIFASIGALRGLMMEVAQNLTGIGDSIFIERMGTNIFGSVVVLSVIAIVVDDFRVDADIKARLQEAERTLIAVREQKEQALRAADQDVLDRVQGAVESALSESGATPERCRQVSEEIVRPISHELAESGPALTLPDHAMKARSARLTFSEAFVATAAPSPLPVAVLVELSVLGAVFGRFGPLIAGANLVLGGAAIYFGGTVFRRFIPLPRGLVLRVLVIAAGFALIGGVSSLLVPSIVTWIIAPFTVPIFGPMVGTAAAALAVTFASAVINGRRQRLDELALAVAESATSLEHLQAQIELRRTQASRFLHGPIQSELVAAAVRRDNPGDVQRVITERFQSYGLVSSARAVREQVEDVLRAWDSVLKIEAKIEESVWHQLEGDPKRAAVIVDALSESFTNVVRHASSRKVVLTMASQAGTVELRITSLGPLVPNDTQGWGLNQLRDRGAFVELVSRDGSTTVKFLV